MEYIGSTEIAQPNSPPEPSTWEAPVWDRDKALQEAQEYYDSSYPEHPKGFIHAITTGDRATVLEMLKSNAVRDHSLLGAALLVATNCGMCRPAPDPNRAQFDSIAKLLVDFDADVNYVSRRKYVDQADETALMNAASKGSAAVVKLLAERGADVNAVNGRDGMSALMQAAWQGQLDTVRELLAQNADIHMRDYDAENNGVGRTAADYARMGNHPMILALLSPEEAKQNGLRLREEFAAAKLVHVLSTRYQKDRALAENKSSCDPWDTAAIIKSALEQLPVPAGTLTFGDEVIDSDDDTPWATLVPVPESDASEGKVVRVFNPNSDNAFLMEGDSASANAIWLRNWRDRLEDARRTGGAVVQVLVQPGLSHMQIAEADMAADKGVPVVIVDCLDVRDRLDEMDVNNLPGIRRLKLLADRVRRGETLRMPPSRSELLDALKVSKGQSTEPQLSLRCLDLHPHALAKEPKVPCNDKTCDVCQAQGTHFHCTRGCDYDLCNDCALLLV